MFRQDPALPMSSSQFACLLLMLASSFLMLGLPSAPFQLQLALQSRNKNLTKRLREAYIAKRLITRGGSISLINSHAKDCNLNVPGQSLPKYHLTRRLCISFFIPLLEEDDNAAEDFKNPLHVTVMSLFQR